MNDLIIFIIIFGTIASFIYIVFDYQIDDFKFIYQNKLIRYLYKHSYFGIKKKLLEVSEDYTLKKYILHSSLIIILLGSIVYFSTNNIVYALIIVTLVVFLIPYYRYLYLYDCYNAHLEENIIIYVTSAILFIREKKNSLRILKDCIEIVNNPLKEDLKICVSKIEKDALYINAVDELEDKYPHQAIKKLHLLLKTYRKEGNNNDGLVDYLYHNIEDLELAINEYKAKKKANRKIFYYMVIINCSSILFFKNMFSSSVVDLNSNEFNSTVFLFYIANILTVIAYERKMAKEKVLK